MGGGSVAPFIPKLDAGYSSVVSHRSWMFCTRGRSQQLSLNTWPDGPHISSGGRFGKWKNRLTLPGIELQLLVAQPVCLYDHELHLIILILC